MFYDHIYYTIGMPTLKIRLSLTHKAYANPTYHIMFVYGLQVTSYNVLIVRLL